MNPLQWLKSIYDAFGAAHPTLSLVVVMILAAGAGGCVWVLAQKEYERDHPKPVQPETIHDGVYTAQAYTESVLNAHGVGRVAPSYIYRVTVAAVDPLHLAFRPHRLKIQFNQPISSSSQSDDEHTDVTEKPEGGPDYVNVIAPRTFRRITVQVTTTAEELKILSVKEEP